MTEQELQQACDRFVHNEVKCCLSSLVSALANGVGVATVSAHRHVGQSADEALALADLCEQAAELASPVDDYEEAAIQAGWETDHMLIGGEDVRKRVNSSEPLLAHTWQEACEMDGLDPHQREVFEHWAISSYLADALEAQGEKVDRDFAGLIVWARTTTGQAISMDHCIRTIVEKMRAAPDEVRAIINDVYGEA